MHLLSAETDYWPFVRWGDSFVDPQLLGAAIPTHSEPAKASQLGDGRIQSRAPRERVSSKSMIFGSSNLTMRVRRPALDPVVGPLAETGDVAARSPKEGSYMRKAKTVRIAGFFGALCASAALVGFSVAGTGAYFTRQPLELDHRLHRSDQGDGVARTARR